MVFTLKEKRDPEKNAMQKIQIVMGQKVTGGYMRFRLSGKIILKR